MNNPDRIDVPDADLEAAEFLKNAREAILTELRKRIVGQQAVIDELLISLFSQCHCLLVGVPGLAKTLLISSLAQILDLNFNRIQFTPDLMPSDIIGTDIIQDDVETGSRSFRFIKGPVFANIVLADEINRTPPKTQAALLQAMQEYKVSAGGTTYELDLPFFVLATQNPIEQEGTYNLPEAQLDRFIMKLLVTYPSFHEEVGILRQFGVDKTIPVEKVLDNEKWKMLRDTAAEVKVDSRIEEYMVSLVAASREKDRSTVEFARYIEFGASPRASLYLYRCAKIQALFEGRSFVIPEDVKAVAKDVLRHRIILTYEAESEELKTDDIISEILGSVHVP